MKAIITAIALVSSLSGFAQDFFADADSFLKKNVKNGLVNYSGIKENPSELNALLELIANAPEFEGNEEKAFLINTYNLFVIKGVIDYYPIKGPLTIDGFFDKQSFKLRGSKITLNNLEKEVLAKQFPDARLHFALVCAAIGCPQLGSFAYLPNTLEEQLETQARSVINNPAFIRLQGPSAQVSQIFDWYASDFGGKDKVIPFIQRYLLKKVKLSSKYSFYEYNWDLNDLK